MRPIFNFQFSIFTRRKNAKHFSAPGHEASLQPTTYNPQPNSGFSLIEMLVSMALFTVVVTMAVGALLVLISANLKAQNTQEAVSNIQFALDSMAREIRTGGAYYCSSGTETAGNLFVVQDCSKGKYLSIIEGGKSLTKGLGNNRIAYRYNSTSLSVERKIGSGAWVRLTNPNVRITSMHFNVNNSALKRSTNNIYQPNVTIFIKGEVIGVKDTSSSFVLQTTVTKRSLDI